MTDRQVSQDRYEIISQGGELIEPPVDKAMGSLFRQNEDLILHVPTSDKKRAFNVGIATALGGIFATGVGCLGLTPLICLGTSLLLASPLVALVTHLLFSNQEEVLRLSPDGVQIFRGRSLLYKPLESPQWEDGLHDISEIYFRSGILQRMHEISAPPGKYDDPNKRPGLVILTRDGEEVLLGSTLLTRGKIAYAKAPDITEIAWVSDLLQAHLEKLHEEYEEETETSSELDWSPQRENGPSF